MPCYFNGQITGDDRTSCAATPGKIWQSDPSLMSDPATGQGIPMTGTTEQPLQNLTAYMIPGAGGASQVATKSAPLVKKGMQSLFTKPGVVQKNIPQVKRMSDGTIKQLGTKTVNKPGRVLSVPRASATAIAAGSMYDGTVSPNPYGGNGPVTARKVVQPPKEGKTNVFNGDTNTDPTGDEIQGMGKDKDIPDSIWDKMQTKDYWLNGMEGGSGDWDNRLYRLGEMMSYMGTPLSKRGDSPSKRWTTARTEQDKIKAAIEKERIKAQDTKNTNIFGKVPTSSAKDTIMTELKKKPWLFGFGQQYDEEQLEAFGNKGEIVYMEWIDKGATPTQALKETLDELQLGI
ncbi:MAG: hypothetical protein K0U20_09645 [Proteobacteria bacterium]|nr:hypothetical protein [Pseudomonadota bacterium]